jgi:hypothetical protein
MPLMTGGAYATVNVQAEAPVRVHDDCALTLTSTLGTPARLGAEIVIRLFEINTIGIEPVWRLPEKSTTETAAALVPKFEPVILTRVVAPADVDRNVAGDTAVTTGLLYDQVAARTTLPFVEKS